MNQVHLVVYSQGDGVVILEAWDDKEYAEGRAVVQNGESHELRFVQSIDVQSRPIEEDYRVWVRFKEDGVEWGVEVRLSMPMVMGAFEPLPPGGKWHGSVTVQATSEQEAVVKANEVMMTYFAGHDMPKAKVTPMVPRREGCVGAAGSVS